MIDIGIMALLMAIVAVAGLGFVLLRRPTGEGKSELASLLGDTHQRMDE